MSGFIYIVLDGFIGSGGGCVIYYAIDVIIDCINGGGVGGFDGGFIK